MDLRCIDRRDVLLAIIAAAEKKSLNRVQLQKAVFLVAEEFVGKLPDGFYTFSKHYFGPFSHEVYRDAEVLNDSGCISIKYGAERRDDCFAFLDDCSIEFAALPQDLQRFIDVTVDWIMDMDFPELLRAVYYLHPEYQENSRFGYDEEQAVIESFARGLKQSRQGKTHSTNDVLAELQEA